MSEIFTSEDQNKKLTEKKEKESRKTRSRPDKIYSKNLNNLKKRKAELQKQAKDFMEFQLLTCFIHTVRHGFKVNVDTQESDDFYLNFNSDQFTIDEIRHSIIRYPEERHVDTTEKTSCDFMKNIKQTSSLCEQSILLNLLSNDHSMYLGKNQNLRFKYRFSTILKALVIYIYNYCTNCNSQVPI